MKFFIKLFSMYVKWKDKRKQAKLSKLMCDIWNKEEEDIRNREPWTLEENGEPYRKPKDMWSNPEIGGNQIKWPITFKIFKNPS